MAGEGKASKKKVGGKRAGAGRPVAPMRKKLQELLLGMSEDYAKALEQLRDTDPEAFVREYVKAMPFCVPRLQTTKIETDSPKGFQITITDAGSKSDTK